MEQSESNSKAVESILRDPSRNNVETILRDGSRCDLRPPRYDDVDRIIDYFERLSPASRGFYHPFEFVRTEAERIARETPSRGRYDVLAIDTSGERVAGHVFYRGDDGHNGYPELGLGIADDYHGRGLGRILMRTAIAAARQEGWNGLALCVFKTNSRAVALYTSCGFVVTGETDDRKGHTMRLSFA